MSCGHTSSGLLTADGAIYAGPAKLHAILAGADNTNAATIIIYDNASAASGTVLAKVIVDATTTNVSVSELNVVANNGLYLDIAGTGAEVVIHYSPA